MARDTSDVVEFEEPKQRVTVKWGKLTVIYRIFVALCACIGLLIFSAFWYHSDAHNDLRYVQIRDYERDKAAEKAVSDERERSLDRELNTLRQLLEEMRADVKQLLRKP